MAFVPEVLTRPALCLQETPSAAPHRGLTAGGPTEESPLSGGQRGPLHPSVARKLPIPVQGSSAVKSPELRPECILSLPLYPESALSILQGNLAVSCFESFLEEGVEMPILNK